LAVTLSDVAAMGGVPAWATLALTMPQPDEAWLRDFAAGFFELAEQFDVQLVGGDTTRGPLTITVQVQGTIKKGRAVRRSGAQPGDLVYVTGTVGDAGLALQAWRQHRRLHDPHRDYLCSRLHRPSPRCVEGAALHGLATAMIDISDGLAADLGHILESSRVGARLDTARIPLSESFIAATSAWDAHFSQREWLNLALTAGDDYELCFTAPAERQVDVERIFSQFACGCRAVGVIETTPGLRLLQTDGTLLQLTRGGYEHFAPEPKGGAS
jgi:thiamine-monophosphate kinase